MTGKFHANTTVQAGGICIGDYCVHNFNGESGGSMPMYMALAQSFNTAAIWLSVKIGEAYWPAGKPYTKPRSPSSGARRSSRRRAKWG